LRLLSVLVSTLGHRHGGNKEGGYRGTLYFLAWGITLAHRLVSKPPRHFHAQFATEGATVAMAASALLGRTFSFEVHAPYTAYRRSGLLRSKLRRALFVAPVSRHMVDRITDIAGEAVRDRAHVIRCGIDPDPSSRPPRLPFAPENDTVRILSVGSLIELKGHAVLIRACRLLADKGLSIDCRIVGDGVLRESLKEIIAELGLGGQVTLQGFVAQDGLRKMYLDCDVFVLACAVGSDGDRDGIPVVLMEAMSFAKPVISTPVGGIAELIEHENNGLLIPPREPEALAESILWLASRPETAKALGDAARSTVSEGEFNLSSSTKSLADLIARYTHLTLR